MALQAVVYTSAFRRWALALGEGNNVFVAVLQLASFLVGWPDVRIVVGVLLVGQSLLELHLLLHVLLFIGKNGVLTVPYGTNLAAFDRSMRALAHAVLLRVARRCSLDRVRICSGDIRSMPGNVHVLDQGLLLRTWNLTHSDCILVDWRVVLGLEI